MHQSSDEDPKSNGSNRSNDPTPLHRVAVDANLQLGDLWLSQRSDDVARHQVSATYTYERGYQERIHSIKFPGCHAN